LGESFNNETTTTKPFIPKQVEESFNNESCPRYFDLSLGVFLGFSNIPKYFSRAKERKPYLKKSEKEEPCGPACQSNSTFSAAFFQRHC
jgi:hypothetical protein